MQAWMGAEVTREEGQGAGRLMKLGGVAGWMTGAIIGKLRRGQGAKPRMALVERIALGPRQNLALVEADGRRFLVATSAEGGPAFLALDDAAQCKSGLRQPGTAATRVSW